MNVSVVIPLYNEEGSLKELSRQLTYVFNKLDHKFEVWFVDDGSTDKSMQIARELHQADKRFKILSLRKNSGKSAALSEGFKAASGEIVITMDADLQDDPAEIPNLITKINEGYDLVSGWKKRRHDPLSKTIPSKFFNFITAFLTGIKIHDFNCGLKAYRQEVINDIPVYGELHRYLPVLAHWKGYNVGEIVVQHHPRKFGKTKFGMERFFSGFFDLLTVLFLTKYNQKPLHLFGFFGLICLGLGFAISLYLSILWFNGTWISQRPLFFLGILLIIVGMQSFSIGLIGEMITNAKDDEHSYPIKERIE